MKIASEADAGLILSVGRLERYKGHQRVIAAMPRLLQLAPDARLRVVGGGDYEPELMRLAHETGVAERIEIGPIDATDRRDGGALINRASLVVAMSEYRSQGIAVLEALALRRRVLVADATALSEFVRNGLARGVALDASPDDLAQAMYDALHAPEPPPFELPTWDRCAAELVDLYRSILPAA